jgi:hypothetical protein
MQKFMKKLLFSLISVLTTLTLTAQSQSELLKDFSSKTLVPATVIKNSSKEIKTKEWLISIETTNSNISKITLWRAGVLEEIYEPDIPSMPSYFYNNQARICYLNGVFHYYRPGQNSISVLYLLADNKEKLEVYDVTKTEKNILEYLEKMRVQQRGAKEAFVSDLEDKKEEERLANSLKGKNIKSLEIVWLTKDTETGMQSKIQFGVKALATDGKIFSTDNLGGTTPWDDFTITSVGAIPGQEYLTVETDVTKILNDRVSVTVKNKFSPTITASSSIKISYATPVNLLFTGRQGCPPLISGTGTSGGRAQTLQLTVSNSYDNQYVLIEIVPEVGSIHKLKLQKGVRLAIDATGGNGCSGQSSSNSSSGGRGGNGGNGGIITIIKSANLLGDNIAIFNTGGRSGKGGKGVSYEGAKGNNGGDGVTEIIISAIQLNY